MHANTEWRAYLVFKEFLPNSKNFFHRFYITERLYKNMRIQNINSINILNNKYKNSYPLNHNQSISKPEVKNYPSGYLSLEYFYPKFKSNIKFTAKHKHIMHSGIYEEFIQKYKDIYKESPLEDTVKQILKTEKSIGKGREKEVFDIPKMPEYIVAHLYRLEPKENLAIEKASNIELPKYNFGQAIATNNYDIFIKKKLEGIQNGIDNYVEFIRNIFKANGATEEIAKTYLSKLMLFKDFPQKSYNDFAKKIEYISQNGLKYIDAYNPNNLLIDTKNQSFNIIDVSTRDDSLMNSRLRYPNCNQNKTSIYDIINLLLDSKFQYYFLKKMSPEEQKTTFDISEDVINKCINAAKDLDFAKSDDFFIKVISHMDKKRDIVNGNLQLKSYLDFKQKHQKSLSNIKG